jgi:hypothetical protein
VMGRRKVALGAEYEQMLREVFAMTRGSRAEIAPAETQHRPARANAASSDVQLARAEVEAIRAFA